MTDAGDALPLKGGGGGVEGAGRAEEDVFPLTSLQMIENVAGQYRGAAPTA